MTVELISAFVVVLFLVIIYERRCYNYRRRIDILAQSPLD